MPFRLIFVQTMFREKPFRETFKGVKNFGSLFSLFKWKSDPVETTASNPPGSFKDSRESIKITKYHLFSNKDYRTLVATSVSLP